MKQSKYIDKEARTANSTFAIDGGSCFADSFVVKFRPSQNLQTVNGNLIPTYITIQVPSSNNNSLISFFE